METSLPFLIDEHVLRQTGVHPGSSPGQAFSRKFRENHVPLRGVSLAGTALRLIFHESRALSEQSAAACVLTYRNRAVGDTIATAIRRRCVCRSCGDQYGDRESNGFARLRVE